MTDLKKEQALIEVEQALKDFEQSIEGIMAGTEALLKKINDQNPYKRQVKEFLVSLNVTGTDYSKEVSEFRKKFMQKEAEALNTTLSKDYTAALKQKRGLEEEITNKPSKKLR
ncbi:MAG: hypothetical protein EPO11_05875 [Gammaproteobacteria bacterium]|nr:MAG: hypothetical protein EPO11_05875 [Gammaproteobacteria bacterium]